MPRDEVPKTQYYQRHTFMIDPDRGPDPSNDLHNEPRRCGAKAASGEDKKKTRKLYDRVKLAG